MGKITVLESAGLIKIKEGDLVTPKDITENNKKLEKIKEPENKKKKKEKSINI